MIFKVECSKGVVEQKCGKKEEKLTGVHKTRDYMIHNHGRQSGLKSGGAERKFQTYLVKSPETT